MGKRFRRIILIVLDGVGIGELPDAARYGDEGSDTLGNLAKAVGGLSLPNLEKLGLGAIAPLDGVSRPEKPLAAYGKCRERSEGKDTTTGHWEIAGLVLDQPFQTFPNGFPTALITAFVDATGFGVIGNCPASGTEIIQRLGDTHIATRKLIVYTSADSVFQIAAHMDVIPLNDLYRVCEIARDLCDGYNIGRVIARPFSGASGAFERTLDRKDFSMRPIGETVLDHLKGNGLDVVAIGKLYNIFAGRGITRSIPTKGNMDGVDQLLTTMHGDQCGIIFINLIDFDMLYGHRNDVPGFYESLKAFDRRIPEILHALRPDDLLMVTADHGNDPTTPSTDHAREYTPLLVYHHGIQMVSPVDLGIRETFSDIAKTIDENFGMRCVRHGTSFLAQVERCGQ